MKLYRIFYKVLIVLVFTGLIASCEQGGFFGIGTSEQYSLVPTEGLTTDAIPQKDFFYVNLSASYYYGEGFDPLDAIIYAMDSGPGTDCKIAISEDSTEDLYCILDVMEGDLYLHKIVLEYNTPPSMCAYTSFSVPWHFNRESGEGDREIYKCNYCSSTEDSARGGLDYNSYPECNTEDKCLNAENNCGRGTSSEPEAGTWRSGFQLRANPYCGDYSSRNREDFKSICNYVYSDSLDDSIKHCCFGDYTINEWSADSRRFEPVSKGKWEEDFKECLGGPGRFSWDAYNKSGFPQRVITNTEKKGLKKQYELDALINIYDGRPGAGIHPKPVSFITANYWKDAEDKAFNDSASSLPEFYRGATNKVADPYFAWGCLDRAQEIKHRIILLIREWNTQEEFNNFKNSLGSNGDPDVEGVEGSLCDYYTSEESDLFKNDSDCNDLIDLDDWIKKSQTYPEVTYKDSG